MKKGTRGVVGGVSSLEGGEVEERGERDQRLVRSVLEGNAEAFGELVQAYQRLVGSIAWRYGVRREEIEDVVSEVFIKVFRNLHRYHPDHPFSTWLYRLAANHVVDHGRRARRLGEPAELPAELADERPDNASDLESRERASLLRAALAEVGPRYREALFLVYIEGLPVQEAAATLGLPDGTVKSRLLRGREALRRILTRRHPEHFGG